jgi:hypothetical protein
MMKISNSHVVSANQAGQVGLIVVLMASGFNYWFIAICENYQTG